MRKCLAILLSLLFVGCAAEQEEDIIGSFMLQAESGYIAADNDQDANVYIIDTYSNEVYVGGKGKTFTKEDRERFEAMTSEEKDEFIGAEEVEDPIHKIKSLDATKDCIILEYEDELIEFTALSDSFFETESGVRYRFEEDTSVADYEESLHEQ